MCPLVILTVVAREVGLRSTPKAASGRRWTGMTKSKKHNHIVPVHYLDGFSDDDGQIVQVRLADQQPKRISSRDAAVRSNFYNIELDGESSNWFEDAFGEVESSAAEPLRRLARGDAPFSLDDRDSVATWCAAQYLRGPDIRQAHSDLIDMLFKADVLGRGPHGVREALEHYLGRPPTDDEVAEEWEVMSDVGAYRLEARAEHQLETMADTWGPCVRSFLARPWSVLRFKRRRLGTCDAPVVLVPYLNQPLGATAGFANARYVILPLRRDAVLVMGELESSDKVKHTAIPVRQGTTKWEKTVNNLIAGVARSALFHHPDDDPFNSIELSEPRDREVDGAEQLFDIVTAMRDELKQR